MTFTARAIAALEATMHTAPATPLEKRHNESLDTAIHLLITLAAAGPTEEELYNVAELFAQPIKSARAAWRAAVGE
jgi:hypothetical protein